LTQSNNVNLLKNAHKQLEVFAGSGASNCGCSTSSYSDESVTDTISMSGNVTIDGQEIKFTPFDNNIVELASRMNIKIPAPCYHNNRSKGCCSACLVEVNGEQMFACSTAPKNGMNIVVGRDDLKEIRKKHLLEYKEGIKTGNPCKCSSSSQGDCCG